MTTTDAPSTALAPRPDTTAATYDPDQAAGALQHILATGDLAKLSNAQRVGYYLDLCRSLGLNPRSRPFDWLMLDNRLVLYPNKSCAEQLRRAHQISVKVLRREMVGELFVVEVEGRTPQGRTDQASKYVPVTKWDRNSGKQVRLAGADLGNAYAKAETGAKRRLAFSMVGLASVPDPEEMAGGRYVVVDGTGAIVEKPTAEQRALAADPVMAQALGEPTYEDAEAESSFDEVPSQAPTIDELTPPNVDRPRPSFKSSEADIKRWSGAYFATVKGTSLDNDDDRHHLVDDWTRKLGWPSSKQTNSLRVMFARMGEDEAQSFLSRVRAMTAAERGRSQGEYVVPPGDDDDGQVEPF
jgi:hypothetical protein